MNNVLLTAEQAQQIEESLESCFCYDQNDQRYLPSAAEEALATIRAARAQEQEPEMCYERINALREGEQNKAEDEYFNARPENDTPTLRKLFCHGFERGFHKGLKYAAPVEPVKQEPVAYAVKSQGSVFSLVSSVSAAEEIVSMLRNDCPDTTFFPLYAAPVRTKDLTDDEAQKLWNDTSSIVPMWAHHLHFARAVIAADREKNK